MSLSINEEPPISLNVSFIGERVLETRTQKNRPKFLIKWRGRNDRENTWEYLSCIGYINAVLQGKHGLLDNTISIRSEYCWTCKESETSVDCPTCKRSFHSKCAKTDRLTSYELANWRCDTCVEISDDEEVNRSKNLNLELLNRLLKLILHRIMDDEEFQYFRFPICKIRRPVAIFTLVNPMNLCMMIKKIDKYKSSADFFSDLQWIFHYCHVHYSDNEQVCKVARRLLNYARNELDSLEMCAECYLKANQSLNHYFTDVCEQPHLLIWAKMKKFPYWPAKLMSMKGNTAKVRFFQDKSNANVPIVDCLIFTREPPVTINQRVSLAYVNAFEEAKMYIENVEKKFGGFNYAKIRTALHPESLSEHLITQIPAIKMAVHSNQVKSKPLTGRRKSIFTIPVLRRKSIAAPPANNGPSKIDVRRRTTFVTNEIKKEIKPSVKRLSTPNTTELDRNPKLEQQKTSRSQTSLKRKLPQLRSENEAKKTPNSARDVLKRAIELETKTLEKDGVVIKRQPQQQQQQQPLRPSNGQISINTTPTNNKNGRPQAEIHLQTPTTDTSPSAPKIPILPSMPNVFDDNDDVNDNVNDSHILLDPRLRSRIPSPVYQTIRESNFTNDSATPSINDLNGANSSKSKRESMCQAFMLKMQSGLRELVTGLNDEKSISTDKPYAKMKMSLELEHAKQLELIEQKYNDKISALEKAHCDYLTTKSQSHKAQIEDLEKAQFDKVNGMKDKYQAQIKKKDNYILQLQKELNALRNRVTKLKK